MITASRHVTSRLAERNEVVAGGDLWNALPVHLRTPQPVNAFKRGLKTYLFSKAFE